LNKNLKEFMLVERTSNEIIFRLPADTDILSLQRILKYLKYQVAIKESKATEANAEEIAEESKANWWKENKSRFIK